MLDFGIFPPTVAEDDVGGRSSTNAGDKSDVGTYFVRKKPITRVKITGDFAYPPDLIKRLV